MVYNVVMMEMRPDSEGVRVETAMASYLAQTSDGICGYECYESTIRYGKEEQSESEV